MSPRLAVFAAALAAGGCDADASVASDDGPSGCSQCPSHRLVFTGDVLLGDAAQPLIDSEGYDATLAGLVAVTRGDTLIGNAEGPITTRTDKHNPGQTWDYNMQPEAAQALADFGFVAMGLGNNHLMDRGPQGVDDTLRHLAAAGVGVFGGGLDADAAAEPYLVDTTHGLVAVVGFGDEWTNSPAATADGPGVIPFDAASIEEGYRRSREAGATHVVAYVHWGANYTAVRTDQRRGAELFAAAGYDLVVGHGPHVVQPFEVVDGMPVAFSLGNFAFGTPGRYSEEHPGYGTIVGVEIGARGLERLEFSCVVTDNRRVEYRPTPCPVDEAREVLAGWGEALVVDGNVAAWEG